MSASHCRSFLFAPADNERKMANALASRADAVILDLEDAVQEASKKKARGLAAEVLTASLAARGPERWVRVNSFTSSHIQLDLEEIVRPGLDGIMLPKAEGIEQLLELDSVLDRLERQRGMNPGTVQVFLVAGESPRGVLRCVDYPVGSPRLSAMTWGPWDLAAAIGASSNQQADGSLKPLFELARSLCLLGSSAAQVAAIETAPMEFRDDAAVAYFARRAASDGFTGVIAIHPSQIQPIHEAMAPAAHEIEHARQVQALFAAAEDIGTVGLGGQMLDRPHLVQAERILARAALTDKRPNR